MSFNANQLWAEEGGALDMTVYIGSERIVAKTMPSIKSPFILFAVDDIEVPLAWSNSQDTYGILITKTGLPFRMRLYEQIPTARRLGLVGVKIR
jgi:hypothetical protein